MFGGPLEYPQKDPKRIKKIPVKNDFHMPDILGGYGHMAREPNTDHHVRMLHFRQRDEEYKIKLTESANKSVQKEIFRQKFETHCDQRRFRNEIKDRVQIRLKEYEESIEKRRTKLRQLFGMEEREFLRDTIDNAQRGDEDRFVEMKKKCIELSAKREEERLKVVHQKRIQQYMARCKELRPALAKKHLIESKICQLQQMRENEARREAERELDMMWHHMGTMEDMAKRDRDEQDAIDRFNREKAQRDVLDLQVKGKILLKEEAKRVAVEDRIEMEKLGEQLRREEIEALEKKIQKRNQTALELEEQIKQQQHFVDERKKAEKALDNAFAALTEMELQRERDAIKDTKTVAKREMAMYKKHLQELEEERKTETKLLDELLEEHKKIIMKKQEDAQCKIVAAKRELQKNVLAGRAEQLKLKREQAEQELRYKQAENEIIQITLDMNRRLEIEAARAKIEANRQYRDDLFKQIEYNQINAERERNELERQLALGRLEEERYEKHVKDLISGEHLVAGKHPFRRALEKIDCHCPVIQQKY